MKFYRASVLQNNTYYSATASDFQQHFCLVIVSLLYRQYINLATTTCLGTPEIATCKNTTQKYQRGQTGLGFSQDLLGRDSQKACPNY